MDSFRNLKQNFYTGSDQYARYRPGYPQALFDHLYSLVPGRERAWDCGTGNGQVAWVLAGEFNQVMATDISPSQVEHAQPAPNLQYSLQPAEETDFADNSFDLITVAQAVHWFDFPRFYAEVQRTAKADGVLALIGYGKIRVSPGVDPLFDHLYDGILGKFWDPERRYIDEEYRTLPFPFEAVPAPEFTIRLLWTQEHFLGYLNTWSAVRHFIRQEGYNPVDPFARELAPLWGPEAEKEIRFRLLLRLGRVRK